MTGWTTLKQKKIMIEYMKTHQQLAKDVTSPTFTRSQRRTLWIELMELLNSYGPSRSASSWRSAWKRMCARNPFYEPIIIPMGTEKPGKRKYKKRNPAVKAQRSSVRQKPMGVQTIATGCIQEQGVSESNAHRYLKMKKHSAICESTYPEYEHQIIATGLLNPESTTELEESASRPQVDQKSNLEIQHNGFLDPESTTEVEESTQVSSPHVERTEYSSIVSYSLARDAETSDIQEEERVCASPQSTPVVEESAAGTSQQQRKRDRSATLECLRTITENVVKTQQSMTEAVWALVKVQEERAKAEQSMAQSGKKFVDLLENWLKKK